MVPRWLHKLKRGRCGHRPRGERCGGQAGKPAELATGSSQEWALERSQIARSSTETIETAATHRPFYAEPVLSRRALHRAVPSERIPNRR